MNRRTFVVAGALGILIAAVVVVGVLVTKEPDSERRGNSQRSPSPKDVRVEVEQAYLAYWNAYTEALVKLDPSGLDEVLTGKALETTRSFVEQQREKNQPIRVRVRHNYQISIVREDFASVDDTFVDSSVRLDPETKQPIEPEPSATVRNSYTLRKVGGRWKVSEIIGYEPGSPSS